MRRIAVFDIDGTLLPGATAEGLFVRYLLEKGELGPRAFGRALGRFLGRFASDWAGATRINKVYLRGSSHARLAQLAAVCFATRIAPRLSALGAKAVAHERAAGREIVLLSGTLDLLMKPISLHFGADHAHAARLAHDGGVCTGEILGEHPYGPAKSRIIREHYPPEEFDLHDSTAYADRASDLDLLGLFGRAYLVNGRGRARRLARARGLGIRKF